VTYEDTQNVLTQAASDLDLDAYYCLNQTSGGERLVSNLGWSDEAPAELLPMRQPHRNTLGTLLWGVSAASALCCAGVPTAVQADTSADAVTSDMPQTLQEVTVTAERLELLGTASSASEGVVADEEIQLAPAYRPGQQLETVPGLIVTLHSGEGKANQFLLRGYNLDHGTDLETYVDDMPVNQPTHAHGQGYTDLNFVIPELSDAISYTKGPYYANVGDFGAVGSVRMSYRDTIADQVSATVGTLDYQRYLAAGSESLGDGHLLAAAEFQHYDGPFQTPDDARKENLVLRYSQGDQQNGYSITSCGPTRPTSRFAPSPRMWSPIASAPSIPPTAAMRSARASQSIITRVWEQDNSRRARSSSTINCIYSTTSRTICSIPSTAIRKTSSRIAA